jgi:hypothetical protein
MSLQADITPKETRHRPNTDEEVHAREWGKGSQRQPKAPYREQTDPLPHERAEPKALNESALRATTDPREPLGPKQNAQRSPREAGHVQQAL